jgi:ribosomal-protein-alanine N-acetyltransferase
MTDPVELRTERLLRRAFELDDVEDVFAYASDPELTRYLPAPQPYARQDAEEFVARRVLASWDTRPVWALALNGSVIGDIELRFNPQHETAELGYSVARDHWGKGLAPEAARAVVQWGFEERGLAKVFARADARNTNSRRVMEKLGMTREGLLRSHLERRGQRIDEVYYGVLRAEWLAMER